MGRIHLLIGIQEAAIFPFVANRRKHVDGNLRLLTSIFGSGWLLDGSHPSIDGKQVLQNQEASDRSHYGFQSLSGIGKPVPKIHHLNLRKTRNIACNLCVEEFKDVRDLSFHIQATHETEVQGHRNFQCGLSSDFV